MRVSSRPYLSPTGHEIRTFGTGFFVSRRHVLTCKHVVSVPGPGEVQRRVQNPIAPDIRVEVNGSDVRCTVLWDSKERDFALLELPTEFPGVAPLAFVQGIRTGILDGYWEAERIHVAGFHGDEPTRGLFRKVIDSPPSGAPMLFAESELWRDVRLDTDFPPGFSGSPVLVRHGQQWLALGMLFLGGVGRPHSSVMMADAILQELSRLAAQRHGCASEHLGFQLNVVDAQTWAGESPDKLDPLPPNPYRGLEAFREQDHKCFFGRDEEIGRLSQLIQERSFIPLVGPSGCGKTSLLLAGVLPRLSDSNVWSTIYLRPTADPVSSMATSIVDALYDDPVERASRLKELANGIARDNISIAKILDDIARKQDRCNLLFVVDQAEELFTLASAKARELTLRLLSTIHTQKSLCGHRTVLISMRADFLNSLLSDPIGGVMVNRHAVEVVAPVAEPAMLRAVIERPSELAGVDFEYGLVDTILVDCNGLSQSTTSTSANLPLLQFILAQMWAQQSERCLTFRSYVDLKRVSGALASYAERMYGRFNSDEQQALTRILAQLIYPNEGTVFTRRFTWRSQLGESDWRLVAELANYRLVVTHSDDSTGQARAELVHDSLITHWPRLAGIAEQSRDFRRWQERLRVSMEEWKRLGYHSANLLRGPHLTEARYHMAETRYGVVDVEERNYIARSRRAVRYVRCLRVVAGVIALLTIGVIILQQFSAERNAEKLEIANDIADSERAKRSESEGRIYATRARDAASINDNNLAVAYAYRARAKLRNDAPEISTLAGILLDHPSIQLGWTDESNSLYLIMLNGRVVVRKDWDGFFTEDILTNRHDSFVSVADVGQIVASNDGRLLARLVDDNTKVLVRDWTQMRDTNALSVSGAPQDTKILLGGFSPDAASLLGVVYSKLSGAAPTAVVWNLKTAGDPIQIGPISNRETLDYTLVLNSMGGQQTFRNDLSHSPSGRYLAVRECPSVVRVVDRSVGTTIKSRQDKRTEPANCGGILRFLGEDQVLYSGATGLVIWNFMNSTYERLNSSALDEVAISRSGRLAYRSEAYKIALRGGEGPNRESFLATEIDDETPLGWLAGDRVLATRDDDRINFWKTVDQPNQQPFATFDLPSKNARDVALEPDGITLRIIDSEGLPWLWDLSTLAGSASDLFAWDAASTASSIMKDLGVALIAAAASSKAHRRIVAISDDGKFARLLLGKFRARDLKWYDVPLSAEAAAEPSFIARNPRFPGWSSIHAKNTNPWIILDSLGAQRISADKTAFFEDYGVSNDGQWLFTRSSSGKLLLRNMEMGRIHELPPQRGSRATHHSFSANNKLVAYASHDAQGSEINVWDIAAAKLASAVSLSGVEVTTLEFSPSTDELLLVSGEGKGVQIWNTRTGELADAVDEAPIWISSTAALNPEGLVVHRPSTSQGSVPSPPGSVSDYWKDYLRRREGLVKDESLDQMYFLDEEYGTELYFGGEPKVGNSKFAEVAPKSKAISAQTIIATKPIINHAKVAPKSKAISAPTPLPASIRRYTAAAFAPDGKRVAFTAHLGELHVWNRALNSVHRLPKEPTKTDRDESTPSGFETLDLAFSPRGKYAVVKKGKEFVIWELDAGVATHIKSTKLSNLWFSTDESELIGDHENGGAIRFPFSELMQFIRSRPTRAEANQVIWELGLPDVELVDRGPLMWESYISRPNPAASWSNGHPFHWIASAEQGDKDAMRRLAATYVAIGNLTEAQQWWDRAMASYGQAK